MALGGGLGAQKWGSAGQELVGHALADLVAARMGTVS